MLYVPPSFAAQDVELVRRLIDEHPFATLITPAGDEPHVTHLPLLREGDVLFGHVARANPHWQAFATADSIAIFHGPHAYVSPTWYSAPEAMVPTWNYCVVHVRGRAAIVEDRIEHERIIERMVARYEGSGETAWRFALTGTRREAMLRAIVVFKLAMTDVTAKLKLSQNRDAADRERVRARLSESVDSEARATAAWMRGMGPGSISADKAE